MRYRLDVDELEGRLEVAAEESPVAHLQSARAQTAGAFIVPGDARAIAANLPANTPVYLLGSTTGPVSVRSIVSAGTSSMVGSRHR